MRSNILLRAWAERLDVYLDRRDSLESELLETCADSGDAPRARGAGEEMQESKWTEEMGAHFRRNCSESKMELRVMASGFSATASTIGFRTALTRALSLRASGSFSQS
jgi:hypothetical protein